MLCYKQKFLQVVLCEKEYEESDCIYHQYSSPIDFILHDSFILYDYFVPMTLFFFEEFFAVVKLSKYSRIIMYMRCIPVTQWYLMDDNSDINKLL